MRSGAAEDRHEPLQQVLQKARVATILTDNNDQDHFYIAKEMVESALSRSK